MRPFVFINMAMSIDGKITSSTREFPTFTSQKDRLHMDKLRAQADAILIGAQTLRADNPPLHVRDKAMQKERQGLKKPEGLIYVLVSGSLEGLDVHSQFFAGPASRRIIATKNQIEAGHVEKYAEIWRLGENEVDLVALLERLYKQGVSYLLVEGGALINWGFFSKNLVDELYITIAPTIFGGSLAPTPVSGSGFQMDLRKRLRLLDVKVEDSELFCRYQVLG